jgi:hypothetical protein
VNESPFEKNSPEKIDDRRLLIRPIPVEKQEITKNTNARYKDFRLKVAAASRDVC